ncbi:MAG: hypothetical protein Q8922_00880 [Bacteroidota bacterium]|nr:hypothetical protein [Bacteroidota bacterium]MDP4232587.1 hypothetical protein [Bacteroidota bacterium]MDP4242959.1 hypothetical protein [Bacteroidota bacterium]MDP4286466.1 hypothetical protein [Bacteroidota bacterium]
MINISLNFNAGPWWMYVGLLAVSVLLAIWSYRNTIPRTTRYRRNWLIALRSAGLSALLLAIFQPIISSTSSEKITPSIAVVLDNSQSMMLPEKGHTIEPAAETRRDVMLRSAHDAIGSSILSDASKTSLYTVGDRTVPFPNKTPIDSLRATASATDLASLFSSIKEARATKNIEAIVLYTDGAFTAGENPIHLAEELGVPVYAVGMGDSTEPRDVAVTEIFTNEVATVGAPQPVDITIHHGGIKPGEHVTVELYEESQKIGERPIELTQASGDEAVSFQYTPTSEGVKKLTARVSLLSNEATEKNNLRIAYVRVLKNKFHVILFAGAPSSDVGFLRQYFSENPSLELSTYVQKQGAEYYEGTPTREKLGNVDLVVLAGWPVASTSDASLALVRQLLTQENRSLLFLSSHTLDLGKLGMLGDALPFSVSSQSASQAEIKVGMSLTPASSDQPVLHLPPQERGKITWEGLAPLFKTETHFQARPESQTLAEATVQGVKLGEPLIIARHIGHARQLAVTGYGLWQWKLTSFGREKAYTKKGDTTAGAMSALDLFLSNSTRWLTTEEVNKRLRIEPNRKVYQAGERIDFLAQVYDESYVPIEHADVTARVSGGSLTKPIDLAFEATGNGRFIANIPEGLPKGDYSYTGTATKDGRAIGGDDGRFNVGDFNIELAEPRMRSDILRAIADRTGGKFYTPETAGNLLHDLYASSRFAAKTITNTRDFELWNSWPLLALALLFFSTEWFIRKRLGML